LTAGESAAWKECPASTIENRRDPSGRSPFVQLIKKWRLKEDGREKSYERNPSGVSLVFNQKFFRPFGRSEKLVQAGEKTFSTA
jgi:hypothetical protein